MSESVKNALDSFREEAETIKSKKTNELTKELEEQMKETGSKLKNRFAPWMDGLTDLLDKMGDIPFKDKLSKMATDFLNSQISNLIKLASETMVSGWEALKHIVTATVDRVLDTVISHLSITDEMYLLGIQPLYAMGSNLSYSSDYARNTAIKMDFPKTLEWIDKQLGVSYGLIDNIQRGKTNSTLSAATSKSCIKIFDYVFSNLKKENDVVLSNIKSYEYQIKSKKGDIKTCEEMKNVYNEEYTRSDTTDVRREELEVLIGIQDKSIQEIEKQIKDIESEKKVWDNYNFNYRQLLAQHFKKLLVYSVGNFDTDKVNEYVKKYNIIPAWFGDYDPEFNGKFKFTQMDVNSMAPFYTGDGFNKQIKNDLGDTRLVQTSKLPTYIILKNVYLKKIYILLNSVNIYGRNNQLSSEVLYERLKYPTMDFLSQLADEALGYMIDDGLGRLGIDVLLKIESAIYDYTKSIEGTMIPPTQKKYFQRMSYFDEIPVPLIPYESPDDINNPNLSNPTTNQLRSSELRSMLLYYLNQLNKDLKYKPLFDLYTRIKEKYSSNSGVKQEFYKQYLNKFFALNATDPSFEGEEFFKKLDETYIMNTYTTIMDNIYYKRYKDQFGIIDDSTNIPSEMNQIFLDNYTYLKEFSINNMVSKMTNDEIYSNLLFIYNILGEKAVHYNTKNEISVELLKFIRKHYTENAYTPTFYIQKYLDSLSVEERKNKLIDILKDLDKQMMDNSIFINLKSEVINNIYLQIYPTYGGVIKIEEGVDIDIDDPKIKNEIEKDYKDYWLIKSLIRDFDNKNWLETFKTPIDDLNNTNFKPDEALNYVVFFNPNLTTE